MYYERLHKTALSLVLLAQGMPVLHAGMEFMRTKEIPADILARHPNLSDLYRSKDGRRAFSHNTYNLSDRINGLDWSRCATKRSIVDYTRNLIRLRKNHPLFRLRSEDDIALSLSFIEPQIVGLPSIRPGFPHEDSPIEPALLAWVISNITTDDSWSSVCIVVNPSSVPSNFILPACTDGGSWHLVTDGNVFFESRETCGQGQSLVNALPVLASGSRVMVTPKALYLYAEF
jgi:pullulanase